MLKKIRPRCIYCNQTDGLKLIWQTVIRQHKGCKKKKLKVERIWYCGWHLLQANDYRLSLGLPPYRGRQYIKDKHVIKQYLRWYHYNPCN